MRNRVAKNRANKILAAIVALGFGAFAAAPIRAQAPPPPYQDPGQVQPAQGQVQPPSGQPSADPGVARLSFLRGEVSQQRGDNGEASAATLNSPLVAGDEISTGPASRAELQLDYADVLRLDENAQARIPTLGQNQIQVQLAQGLASYSVLPGFQSDVEIDTSNVAIRPTEPGNYRIQVDPSGNTFVTVREGSAQISTPQGSTTVQKGDLITIRGAGDAAEYQITAASAPDAWDSWNNERDNIIQNAASVGHTNNYYTGASDLDAYGSWGEAPDYGPVWIPRVAAGWAPYRAGRWVWEPYYGWTWVSDEPWGWAPYHYGRWFLYGGSWAWWPGPVYAGYRPIWAPAYVSFFGFGGGVGFGFGFGLGFGFGSVGWLPIGPADFYHPWYGAFRGRYDVVGISALGGLRGGFAPLRPGGFSNLRDVTVNDRLRAGVSSVGADRFGRGAVESRPVSAEDLRSGRGITGDLPVQPSRGSFSASDRAASGAAFSRVNSQSFFSRSGAAAGGSRGFAERGGQSQGFSGGANAGRSSGEAGQSNGGWQHFGNGGAPGGQSYSRPGGNGAGSYRPPSSPAPAYREPLNLNRPIVQQRSQGAGSANGGYRPPTSSYGPGPGRPAAPGYGGGAAPGYSPNRGSAPSYSPNRGAEPSYRSAPAPSYSPSRGAAPSYRGGSSGGYSGRSAGPSSGGRSSGRSSSGGGGGRRR